MTGFSSCSKACSTNYAIVISYYPCIKVAPPGLHLGSGNAARKHGNLIITYSVTEYSNRVTALLKYLDCVLVTPS